jgi:hypothetical protein
MKNIFLLVNLTFSKLIVVLPLLFLLSSCANNKKFVAEKEYSTEFVGEWMGTVGDVKETMNIHSDSTFICQVYPMGFLANTLSEGKNGSISGTWKINGAIITLNITGEKNEIVENSIALSTIESFNTEEIVLKSDGGETTTFTKVVKL